MFKSLSNPLTFTDLYRKADVACVTCSAMLDLNVYGQGGWYMKFPSWF